VGAAKVVVMVEVVTVGAVKVVAMVVATEGVAMEGEVMEGERVVEMEEAVKGAAKTAEKVAHIELAHPGTIVDSY
jgi:hypothetical protein